jgi:hypothetical protein
MAEESDASAEGETTRLLAGEATRRGVGRALSAAEFSAGTKLAQRIADLEELRKQLDHPVLMEQPRLRRRIKNVSFYIEEGKQDLNRLMSIASESEQDLLKQAARGAFTAAPRPLTIPDHRSSTRLAARRALRGASRLAGPALAAYEAARLGHNIYEHGPLEGAKESAGNVVNELSTIPTALSRALSYDPNKDFNGLIPEDWEHSIHGTPGLTDSIISRMARKAGKGLAAVGNLMGEADYWGPEDDREEKPITGTFEELRNRAARQAVERERTKKR